MFRKFTVRLFTIIFLPLVACQLPGGQAAQPAINVTPISTAPSSPTSTTIVEGIPLEFETIELREPETSEKSWKVEHAGLMIIESKNDVEKAKQYVTNEAGVTLEQMDYAEFFALIAFHGQRGTVYYDFAIENIMQNEDQIFVIAHPSRASGDAASSSPYHVVKVRRGDDWTYPQTFHLYMGNEESNASPVVGEAP